MRRWYALFAKPRHEFLVADALEARGIEVFVPCIEYHGKRGTLLDKPFFPRYLFARFDWSDTGWSGVAWTPGLTRIVTFDDKPAYLADERISFIRERLERIDGDDFLRIKPGTRVQVTDGPFREMEAVFDSHLNGQARCAVLLEMLGRETRVVLDASQIRTA